MRTYTDQEVKDFLSQQQQNFEVTARGRGYNAKLAREKLEALRAMSEQDRLSNGRVNLMGCDALQALQAFPHDYIISHK